MNDLCRDLALPKGKSELLASRLQQWNMLQRDVTVTSFRHRHEAFATYFKKVDDLSYCTDITGLMEHLNGSYGPHKWRLFIDSGKGTLKAVLVHNGNIKPSVPLAHTAKMKEEYESMKLLLFSLACKLDTQSTCVFSAYGTAVTTKTTSFADYGLLEHKRLWAGTT